MEIEIGRIQPPGPESSRNEQSLIIPARLQMGITSEQFHGGSSQNLTRRMILFDLLSNFIDLLIVSAALLISFAFAAYFHFLDQSMIPSQQVSFGILAGAFVMTKVSTRIFFSQTLGEWTCGLRIIVMKSSFGKGRAFRIFLRSLVIIASGVILLPLLSYFRNEDLAGRISKAYLFKFSAASGK